MPQTTVLLTFCTASLVLMLLPGPAVIYVVSQTARLGLGRGLAAAAGVECGTLVHVAAATIGLSALLARSSVAFTAVKYAGIAYLLVLAWRQLRTPTGAEGPSEHRAITGTTARSAFRQGCVVEVLNPKTALFFLAFLPQFVDHGAGHEAMQVGALGLAFVVLALVVDVTYALLAAGVTRWLAGDRGGRRIDQVGGVALVGLAAAAMAS